MSENCPWGGDITCASELASESEHISQTERPGCLGLTPNRTMHSHQDTLALCSCYLRSPSLLTKTYELSKAHRECPLPLQFSSHWLYKTGIIIFTGQETEAGTCEQISKSHGLSVSVLTSTSWAAQYQAPPLPPLPPLPFLFFLSYVRLYCNFLAVLRKKNKVDINILVLVHFFSYNSNTESKSILFSVIKQFCR